MAEEECETERCVEVLKTVLSDCQPFRLNFVGLTATREGILANGFFRDGSLDEIRRKLTEAAPEMGIGWSDDPYPRTSAHITVMRFKDERDVRMLVPPLEALSNVQIGVEPVEDVELVFNDWYMTGEKVRLIERFSLHS